MKNLLFVICTLMFGFAIFAEDTTNNHNPNILAWNVRSNDKYLTAIEYGSVSYKGIYIIEYEGVRYIVNAAGGIVRHN